MWRFADRPFILSDRKSFGAQLGGSEMEASVTLTIPRMFADAAGECRFDQTDIPLVMKNMLPRRAGHREHSHGNWAVCLYAYPAGVCR